MMNYLASVLVILVGLVILWRTVRTYYKGGM